MNEFKEKLKEKPGFIKAMWCGDQSCEDKIKDETGATLRCIPLKDEEKVGETCVCCGKPAEEVAYFARAY